MSDTTRIAILAGGAQFRLQELMESKRRIEAQIEEATRAAVAEAAASQPQPRMPGIDPATGEYSTAQMLHDEFYGGDTSLPLFD